LRAKGLRVIRRADYDKAYVDAGFLELSFELAQLRERFTEERSTDVTQPYDERRKRYAERGKVLSNRHGFAH